MSQHVAIGTTVSMAEDELAATMEVAEAKVALNSKITYVVGLLRFFRSEIEEELGVETYSWIARRFDGRPHRESAAKILSRNLDNETDLKRAIAMLAEAELSLLGSTMNIFQVEDPLAECITCIVKHALLKQKGEELIQLAETLQRDILNEIWP